MADKYPSISLSNVRALGASVSDLVKGPDELDDLTTRLGIPAVLVNPNLATEVDLNDFGLGKAIYIPVQVSNRIGGRKSLYYLRPGEKVLTGLFVTSQGVRYRYTTRETGNTIPAQGGDRYSEEIRNSDGEVAVVLRGALEVTSIARGEGRVVFDDAEPSSLAATVKRGRVRFVWIAWSFILVGDEPTTATA